MVPRRRRRPCDWPAARCGQPDLWSRLRWQLLRSGDWPELDPVVEPDRPRRSSLRPVRWLLDDHRWPRTLWRWNASRSDAALARLDLSVLNAVRQRELKKLPGLRKQPRFFCFLLRTAICQSAFPPTASSAG